jgi:hypothetical protein
MNMNTPMMALAVTERFVLLPELRCSFVYIQVLAPTVNNNAIKK